MARIDRTALLTTSLALVLALFGIVSGIAIDRWVLRPHHRAEWFRPGRNDGYGRVDPGRYRTALSARLARELDLTPDQRSTVDSLFARQQEVTRAILREVRPRLEEVTARTRDELRSVLTPAQLEKWERIERERGFRRR